MNRRDFMIKAGRLFLGSSLIAIAVVTGKNSKNQEELCSDNQFCNRCSKLSNCNLDKAAEQREKRVT